MLYQIHEILTLPGVVVQLIVDEVPSSVIFNASYSTDAFMFTIGAVSMYIKISINAMYVCRSVILCDFTTYVCDFVLFWHVW